MGKIIGVIRNFEWLQGGDRPILKRGMDNAGMISKEKVNLLNGVSWLVEKSVKLRNYNSKVAQSGASLTEYTLTISLVALLAIPALMSLGEKNIETFNEAELRLACAGTSYDGGGTTTTLPEGTWTNLNPPDDRCKRLIYDDLDND